MELKEPTLALKVWETLSCCGGHLTRAFKLFGFDFNGRDLNGPGASEHLALGAGF